MTEESEAVTIAAKKKTEPVREAPLVPYEWQQFDIDKIVQTVTPDIGALVVSAPGAGKTVVTVEALKALDPAVILIIAPPSTHESAWERTVLRQGFDREVKKLIGGKQGQSNWNAMKWGTPGIYITSAQWFTQQDWKGISVDAMVVDEVHMLAKFGNAGQKKLLGYRGRPGMSAPIRIALSGTPFRNNFENAWSIAKWVQPDTVPDEYWAWRVTKCVGKYDHFAPQNLKVTGEANPGELVSKFACYISHSQRERCCEFHPNGFLADLAEPIRVSRILKMHPAQAKFYRSMETSYAAFLTTPGEDGKVPVVAEFPITMRGMLRFCALALPSFNTETEKLFFEDDTPSPKLDAAIEDLRGLDGKRALMLTHSAQFAQVAAKRLLKEGFRAVAWTGDLSAAKRKKALSEFRSGELDAIVGVISAMGTGTDGLQEAAYNVMWLSVDDDASNNIQGIGRLDRLGQQHQVTMFEYQMQDTFDVGHLPRQITHMLRLNQSLAQKENK